MPSLALDTDDVPSCSLWPFRRRRRCPRGWAPLSDEGTYRDAEDEKEPVVPALPAYVAAYGSAPPLPPRPTRPPHLARQEEHLHHTTPAAPTPTAGHPHPHHPDPYTALLPLQPGHTGRSHSSSISHASHHTTHTTATTQTSTSEYMSLDADPFDDPESPARIAYLNARLASLQHYHSGAPVDPPLQAAPLESPLSLLDIQDPKARAPVRVAASLGDKKLRGMERSERRLERARAEADAWRHEANLVYHQLCAARILALERMYERNAWRERCEAVEEEAREGRMGGAERR